MNKLLVSLLLTVGLTGLAHAAGDAKAGEAKVAICSACHNPDGNSALPTFPKLAGQGEQYLLKQMQDIQSGKRPVLEMTGMLDMVTAGSSTPEAKLQDLKDIAAYFASQKTSQGTADEALVERGEALFRGGKLTEGMPACIGCHAPDGTGLDLAKYPRLAGQHSTYIAKQLTDFREGDRTNDGDAMTMRAVAAKLSNKDIQALSSYIQGLKPVTKADLVK
ncbi:c-type cytochrome [Pseudomonas sp. F1_0610]|uniref:c-type cytochrome n=1 Tax=Pseudomonas sp. F1_0610 TaxID=3114284 RepID=UPI0039C09E1A